MPFSYSLGGKLVVHCAGAHRAKGADVRREGLISHRYSCLQTWKTLLPIEGILLPNLPTGAERTRQGPNHSLLGRIGTQALLWVNPRYIKEPLAVQSVGDIHLLWSLDLCTNLSKFTRGHGWI